MTDTVRCLTQVAGHDPGDVVEMDEKHARGHERRGRVEYVDTSASETSPKSDEDTREALGEMADDRQQAIREALDSGDDVTMKSTLADVSDIPATGDTEAIRGKLESLLED